MGTGRALLGGLTLALVCAPVGFGARPVSVGYSSPSALRGLDVLTRVNALHVAEVSTSNVAALRARPGIRWVRAIVPRRHLGDTHNTTPAGLAAAEWEFAATRSNLVPARVQRAAGRVTIAVIDTGADISAPSIAVKDPITHNAVTNPHK